MSNCPRISRICENHSTIILDTNTLIHYMKYLSTTKYEERNFREILNDFSQLIRLISNQCSYGRLFASELVLNREYKGTFIYEVRFLNNLSRTYQRRFTDLIETNLKIRRIQQDELSDLRPIANNFSSQRHLSPIDNRDLSLLIGALEEINEHPNWRFLIVTGDDSFRKFVSYVKAQNQIILAGTTFNTSNINGVIFLTYLTHLFKCCQYNELKEFRIDILMREIFGKEERVQKRKLIEYNKWIFEVYGPALLEKQSIGVCTN